MALINSLLNLQKAEGCLAQDEHSLKPVLAAIQWQGKKTRELVA